MRQHIIDGTTMKRICGDNTHYGYVSDEVYKTWEKCSVCFSEGKTISFDLFFVSKETEWALEDLNPRPAVYKTDALPD